MLRNFYNCQRHTTKMSSACGLFCCVWSGMILMVYLQDLLDDYPHPVVHPE